MLRSLFTGLLATAVLLASSIAYIAWLTRFQAESTDPMQPPDAAALASGDDLGQAPSAHAVRAPRPVAPLPSAAPALRPRLAARPAEASGPRPSAALRRVANPRRDPRERTGQKSMPRERKQQLSSFRREIIAGFAALERDVARCRPGDASFMLDVETVSGGARIVEAALHSRGSASDAAIACARSKLLGYTISAPSAEPERHLRMPFSVKRSI